VIPLPDLNQEVKELKVYIADTPDDTITIPELLVSIKQCVEGEFFSLKRIPSCQLNQG
jgi:hypothetical protein